MARLAAAIVAARGDDTDSNSWVASIAEAQSYIDLSVIRATLEAALKKR